MAVFKKKNLINTCFWCVCNTIGFIGGTVTKNLPDNVGDAKDTGMIPGSGRSPGVDNGNSLQYSYLENSMDKRSLAGYSLLLLFSHPVMSDSCDHMDNRPTRLLCPWDSPGLNTGVGCPFLF